MKILTFEDLPLEATKAFSWYDCVTRAAMRFYVEFRRYSSPKR